MRRKNARHPSERIEELLINKSFVFCDEFNNISFFTDGVHIIAINNIPSLALLEARQGKLLKEITLMTSTPAPKAVFKRAKVTASKTVLPSKNLYVVDMNRCRTSQIIMTNKNNGPDEFMPNYEVVAEMTSRLKHRIKQQKHESERGDAKNCDNCGFSLSTHNLCQHCNRKACANTLVSCRQCGTNAGCIFCGTQAIKGRTGYRYCSIEHVRASEKF